MDSVDKFVLEQVERGDGGVSHGQGKEHSTSIRRCGADKSLVFATQTAT